MNEEKSRNGVWKRPFQELVMGRRAQEGKGIWGLYGVVVGGLDSEKKKGEYFVLMSRPKGGRNGGKKNLSRRQAKRGTDIQVRKRVRGRPGTDLAMGKDSKEGVSLRGEDEYDWRFSPQAETTSSTSRDSRRRIELQR